MDVALYAIASGFLSTPSARRATWSGIEAPNGAEAISIHALREEGDYSYSSCSFCVRDFYPRPPRGGRRVHHGGRDE